METIRKQHSVTTLVEIYLKELHNLKIKLEEHLEEYPEDLFCEDYSDIKVLVDW